MQALVKLKAPFKFTFSTRSQSASDILIMRLSRVIPALLTNISILPHFSTTAFTTASTWSGLVTSQPMPKALPLPAAKVSADFCASSALTSTMATFAPWAAKTSAVAYPIPCAEPVMIATRSLSRWPVVEAALTAVSVLMISSSPFLLRSTLIKSNLGRFGTLGFAAGGLAQGGDEARLRRLRGGLHGVRDGAGVRG